MAAAMRPEGLGEALEGVVEGVIARIREAGDAGAALGRALRDDAAEGAVGVGKVAVLAFGKASVAMARVAAEFLGARMSRVMVVTLAAHEEEARAWGAGMREARGEVGVMVGVKVGVGDHPMPTARSVLAAKGAMEFVESGEEEELWVLVSGGGSAMLALPHDGVELDELARLTRAIQNAGGTIHDLNTVRRHLEGVKGGQLAAAARAKRVRGFVLSDVIGDAMETIASGPTAADPTTPRDALEVIERLGLMRAAREVAPAWGGCVAFLERCVGGREGVRFTVPPGDERLRGVENRIIASNALVAREAAAYLRERGIEVVGVEERVEGEAREIGARLAREGMAMKDGQALVVAGEWTVNVRGVGDVTDGVGAAGGAVGGPSQELALAAACGLDGVKGVRVVAISTDGRDGPTDAAGAVVDGQTCARARAAGVEPRDALARHDSTRALDAAGGGALIRIGATGTNLNHVAVVLRGGSDGVTELKAAKREWRVERGET
jgi:hydroxypyruvate reductase